MKKYNPLMLDTEKDTPSFSNDKADFWLIDKNDKQELAIYLAKQKNTNTKDYILSTYDGKPLSMSKRLEDVATTMDLYSVCKDKKWLN